MFSSFKKVLVLMLMTVAGLAIAGCNTKQKANTAKIGPNEEVGEAKIQGNTSLVVEGSIEQVEETNVIKKRDTTEAHTLANELANKADVTIDMVGTSFSFSPSRIEVRKGDVVTINFSSEEGFHDRVLDGAEYIATEQVNPGTTSTITFVAGSAGEYVFYCSVGDHRAQGMVGEFVVTTG